MGFANFILNNGPGSPGSVAKQYCQLYRKRGIHNQAQHEDNGYAALFELYGIAAIAGRRVSQSWGNIIEKYNPPEVLKFCKNDLRLFIFTLYYMESKKVRSTLSALINGSFERSQEAVEVVTDIIADVVKKEIPWAVTMNTTNFYFDACELANCFEGKLPVEKGN